MNATNPYSLKATTAWPNKHGKGSETSRQNRLIVVHGPRPSVRLGFLLNIKGHRITEIRSLQYSWTDRKNWLHPLFLLHSMMPPFGCEYNQPGGFKLAKEDVAINKFTSLLESQLHHQNLSPPNCYRDSDTAWEIIVIMAMYFRRLLRERVEKSPVFWHHDWWNNRQFNKSAPILYIKFLDKNSTGELESVVEYLDLVSPKSSGAEDLTVPFQ